VHKALLGRAKRLMFYAQSIGRFRDERRRAELAHILNAADVVILREPESQAEVVRLGVPVARTEVTADEAFLLYRPPPSVLRRRTRRSMLACLSAHPWVLSDGSVFAAPWETLVERLADAISFAFSKQLVERVSFASTTQGLGGPERALEDDFLLASEVAGRLRPDIRSRVSLVDGYLTPAAFARLVRQHDVVMSMRMHGAIIAATIGRPVLLANASTKAMSLVRRSHGRIAGISIDAEWSGLCEAVNHLCNPRGVRLREQTRAVADFRHLAARNAHIVSRVLKSGPN
jgi:polysaccharide pyruvyl transferase WcaK-like protein